MLGISIGLNSVSDHGACTAIFVAIACVVGFALSSIQTLHKISWLAWVGLTCILTASTLSMMYHGTGQRKLTHNSLYRHNCRWCTRPPC